MRCLAKEQSVVCSSQESVDAASEHMEHQSAKGAEGGHLDSQTADDGGEP